MQEELAPAAQLLEQTSAFYQLELHRYPEGIHYLAQRGLHDPALIEELGIGYARGGNLRRSSQRPRLFPGTALAGRLDRPAGPRCLLPPGDLPLPPAPTHRQPLWPQYRRRLSPSPAATLQRRLVRLGIGPPAFSEVILVEGLFDLAVLWQEGFRNTTCAIGTHLTPLQLAQLCENRDRSVYLAFDQDDNHAGQCAAQALAQRLRQNRLRALIVSLPAGHDPNSYIAAGATNSDFRRCLDQAQSL